MGLLTFYQPQHHRLASAAEHEVTRCVQRSDYRWTSGEGKEWKQRWCRTVYASFVDCPPYEGNPIAVFQENGFAALSSCVTRRAGTHAAFATHHVYNSRVAHTSRGTPRLSVTCGFVLMHAVHPTTGECRDVKACAECASDFLPNNEQILCARMKRNIHFSLWFPGIRRRRDACSSEYAESTERNISLIAFLVEFPEHHIIS